MEIAAAIIVFLVGSLVGASVTFSVAKFILFHDKVPKKEFDQINAEKFALQTQLEEEKSRTIELKQKVESLTSEIQTVREKSVALETEKNSFDQKVENHKSELLEKQYENIELKHKIDSLSSELQTFREKSITLEAEKHSLNERIQEHKADLEQMQEKFKLHFENLANNIFDEKTNKFKQQSQEILNEFLSPLKERITEFHKKVDESFGTQAKEQFALKEEIKRIVEVNEKMTFQAENLSRALKGDIKVQGNWGEIILEKILEESGLRKDHDYILQGVDMQLKHPEGGQTQKPDVIVRLPEEKHVIIDSKVSLTHYERFCAEEDDDGQRAGHLKQFLLSVKNHVSGLEQRRYQDTDKLNTPDFVLMFMPIEGAYALAVQKDRDLHGFAWSKKIIIVCPSTLYATLKTIASLWRLELQNRNAQEIARRGGALYDKISGFVEDMQKIGNQLENIGKTYSGAMNKLSDGRGNILRQTEQLKALGAKASKNLPKELINADADNESDDQKSLVDV